jgi:serine/threonine protein kinase
VAVHTQNLYRAKATLEQRLAAGSAETSVFSPTSPGLPLAASPLHGKTPWQAPERGPQGTMMCPNLADHTLLRQIGKGAYGEVWLARSAIGLFHAAKIVYRHHFQTATPYEREFRGIEKYMPISLNHPSLAHILHVGRNDQAGHFYYIMELGDDENTGTQIDPQNYSPRNLAKDLRRHRRLPKKQCLDLFLALTAALDYLHQQKLVHRDIKPSNIIFVKGQPKFADIGLVTETRSLGRDMTFIGTEGYIAPEGPGTPAADVYSLGKMLYETALGLDRKSYPDWPAWLARELDERWLTELKDIINKACDSDPIRRYQTASEMRQDLGWLQSQFQATQSQLNAKNPSSPDTTSKSPGP